MENFNPNSNMLYILVGVVIAFVIAQSLFFIFRAIKRAKQIGIENKTIKSTIASSAVFSIAPAVAILIGIISLSQFLGFPLPWLRLSVIGAITYEFAAATTAASALGISTAQTITDANAFSAIAWVMTLGIIPSLILTPIFGKKIQKGVINLKNKNEKWGKIFMDALFLGMISAFLGMVFADVTTGLIGFIPVFVMMASCLAMAVFGIGVKKYKIKWLEDFALPLSMLCAMALAIPITNIVNSIVS